MSRADPIFTFIEEGRLKIVKDGPLMPGIDLLRLSQEAANALKEADFVFSIGETNFEMLNGLQKNTFHLFVVSSRESSVVTGLPKNTTVFCYIPSGLKYFGNYAQKKKLLYGTEWISAAGKSLMDVLPTIQNKGNVGINLRESRKNFKDPKSLDVIARAA